MLPVSNLGGVYEVPPSIKIETIAHLRLYPATEAVCFWLGTPALKRGAKIKEIWAPEFTATPVSYDIDPFEMLRLKAYLDQTGLLLLCQAHSHPGSAFHSSRDDMNAASPWPGFISIVVPNFGRILHEFWNSVEVYELLGGARWKHVAAKEKSERFYED